VAFAEQFNYLCLRHLKVSPRSLGTCFGRYDSAKTTADKTASASTSLKTTSLTTYAAAVKEDSKRNSRYNRDILNADRTSGGVPASSTTMTGIAGCAFLSAPLVGGLRA
jgi:hypothetical protein